MSQRMRWGLSAAVILLFFSISSHSQDIHTAGSLISDATSGTPPLIVASPDLVTNLNADMLDGIQSTEFALKTEVPDDGKWKINQNCALNGGCFAGDTAGFPVTITEASWALASSYILTSDIDVSSESTPEEITALVVDGTASPAGITIDLGGFSIRGPTTCTGSDGQDLSCSPFSNDVPDGSGIQILETGVTVRNGQVIGMGAFGVVCEVGCRILDLLVMNSGGTGVQLDGSLFGPSGNLIEAVTSSFNRGSGILATGGIVTNSTVVANGGQGIQARNGTLVSDNVAKENGFDGISGSDNIFARGNQCVENVNDGLSLTSGSTARENVMHFNGNADLTISGSAAEFGDNWCSGSLCSP